MREEFQGLSEALPSRVSSRFVRFRTMARSRSAIRELGSFNSTFYHERGETDVAWLHGALFSFTGGKVISDSLQIPVNFGPIEQASETNYQNGLYNRAAERSVDPADVSKRAVVSLLYEFPSGRTGALQQADRRMAAEHDRRHAELASRC